MSTTKEQGPQTTESKVEENLLSGILRGFLLQKSRWFGTLGSAETTEENDSSGLSIFLFILINHPCLPKGCRYTTDSLGMDERQTTGRGVHFVHSSLLPKTCLGEAAEGVSPILRPH